MINYKAMSILIPETPRRKHCETMELTGSSRWGGSEDKNTEAGSDLEMGGTPQCICGRKAGRQEGREEVFLFQCETQNSAEGCPLRGGSRERHSGRESSTGGCDHAHFPCFLTHVCAAFVLWHE